MTTFSITARELENSLKTLLPFASKEEARYYLCGVFFDLAEDASDLNLVATDGHKLCALHLQCQRSDGENGLIAAILPIAAVKTILQMTKSLSEQTLPIMITIEDLKFSIDTVDQTATFKLIDGTYPDYRRVIPSGEPKFTIGLGLAQAAEALKAIKAHGRSPEILRWEMTDDDAPIKLSDRHKTIVVMPARL